MTRRADTGRTICKFVLPFITLQDPQNGLESLLSWSSCSNSRRILVCSCCHPAILEVLANVLIPHFKKLWPYPGLVEDHEELVAEGLVHRVRLPFLVAEESLQQVGKLVYVDGAVTWIGNFIFNLTFVLITATKVYHTPETWDRL